MKILGIIISFFLWHLFVYAQQEESIEVFLIDAYATPEIPHTFVLSFFTSEPSVTKVKLEKKYVYDVSTEFSEIHNISIDLSKLEFENKTVKFIIESTDSLGNTSINDEYDFDIPFEPVIESGSSLFTFCLFGGMIFALPAPGYVNNDFGDYFSLTKEIPVLSFRSRSFHYPASYISIEYTYIFNANGRNLFRAGYKRLFELDFIKYISPGLTAFTNFKGQNGIAPEVSLGLFTIFNNSFTVYSRYRFNYKPNDNSANFHEVNLGLYSSFFSFYLK
ncbi:MAG: hypothetical protein KGZ85_13590 [Ignavibacterium sp.]|nr:hypothetical protein [Ignavibacterium sp.]